MITTCLLCQTDHEDRPEACPRRNGRVRDRQAPLIGLTVRDRYLINALLGTGAMGVVYKATQLSDNKEVAIKVLHTHLSSDPESLNRFHHEARAASSLLHPHIVRLYDVGMLPGGQPYLAMEYLEGKTLGQIMREKTWFSTKEALPLLKQTCEALAEAHGHGVLHRDIKPANIMLMNRFGQENFVVVLDFSISKVIQKVSDVDTTTPGVIFGSPLYMSPERFMGKGGDFRADIYSMGIIMFQMLAGKAPFKAGDLYTLMNEHVATVPPAIKQVRPDADVPEELERIIAKALAKKPEERHANMRQLLSEINEVLHQTTTSLVAPVAAIAEQPAMLVPGTNTPATSYRQMPQAATATPAVSARVFEIDPGIAESGAFASVTRKLPEDASTVNKALERSLTGQFDKSLIIKKDMARPAIRPPEDDRRLNIELLGFVSVVVIAVVVVILSLLAGPPHQAPVPALSGSSAGSAVLHPAREPREASRRAKK